MNPMQLSSGIETALKANIPLFISGAPGVGKSSIVKQVAERNSMQVIDLRLSQLDAVDLRGLPHVDAERRSQWAVPGFFPTDPDTRAILFLDELPHASEEVMASAFQLILDRRVGDYQLPPGVRVIAAGNREVDATIHHALPSALVNRFMHITVTSDPDSWLVWALRHDIDPRVAGFIQWRPNLINEFYYLDQLGHKNDLRSRIVARMTSAQAMATERSWEALSRLLPYLSTSNADKAMTLELIEGTVGSGAAVEFLSYLRLCEKLPDPAAALRNPAEIDFKDLKSEPSILFAFTTAITNQLKKSATESTIHNAFVVFNEVPPEFAVTAIKTLLKVRPQFAVHEQFNKWVMKHAMENQQ